MMDSLCKTAALLIVFLQIPINLGVEQARDNELAVEVWSQLQAMACLGPPVTRGIHVGRRRRLIRAAELYELIAQGIQQVPFHSSTSGSLGFGFPQRQQKTHRPSNPFISPNQPKMGRLTFTQQKWR